MENHIVPELGALPLDEVSYSKVKDLIVLLSRTGLRFREAAALEVRDVDFQDRKIKVRRSRPAAGRGDVVFSVKTPSSRREVDMSRGLEKVLRAHLTRRKEDLLRMGVTEPPDLLFSGPEGGPAHVTYGSFRSAWERILRLAKVRYRSPHNLRHTFAGELLSQSEPLLYVSRQLGHADPSITLKVYARWVPRESTARGVDKLDLEGGFSGEEKVNPSVKRQ